MAWKNSLSVLHKAGQSIETLTLIQVHGLDLQLIPGSRLIDHVCLLYISPWASPNNYNLSSLPRTRVLEAVSRAGPCNPDQASWSQACTAHWTPCPSHHCHRLLHESPRSTQAELAHFPTRTSSIALCFGERGQTFPGRNCVSNNCHRSRKACLHWMQLTALGIRLQTRHAGR